MCVYDVCQLETALDLLLENRQDPSHSVSASTLVVAEEDQLWWVRWIDDHGLSCLVIGYEVGVVVARALPYRICQYREISTEAIRVLLHIGIDWICIAREATGCLASVHGLSLVNEARTFVICRVSDCSGKRLVKEASRLIRRMPANNRQNVVNDIQVQAALD
jgi:hypothetical protein